MLFSNRSGLSSVTFSFKILKKHWGRRTANLKSGLFEHSLVRTSSVTCMAPPRWAVFSVNWITTVSKNSNLELNSNDSAPPFIAELFRKAPSLLNDSEELTAAMAPPCIPAWFSVNIKSPKNDNWLLKRYNAPPNSAVLPMNREFPLKLTIML